MPVFKHDTVVWNQGVDFLGIDVDELVDIQRGLQNIGDLQGLGSQTPAFFATRYACSNCGWCFGTGSAITRLFLSGNTGNNRQIY